MGHLSPILGATHSSWCLLVPLSLSLAIFIQNPTLCAALLSYLETLLKSNTSHQTSVLLPPQGYLLPIQVLTPMPGCPVCSCPLYPCDG